MDERIKWIEHKGKRILQNDLSNLSADEVVDGMKKFEKLVLSQVNKNILVFSDISGVYFNTKSLQEVKRVADTTKNYIPKYAVIGVTGIKRVLFRVVKKIATTNLEALDSIDKAKDWLIS